MDSRTARIVAEVLDQECTDASVSNRFEVAKILAHLSSAASRIADRLEQHEAGKPAPVGLFEPFNALVVWDKERSVRSIHFGPWQGAEAGDEQISRDELYPSIGPHRVVPVLVTPVKEAE